MGPFERRKDKSDKPGADFSNVQGGSSSTAPGRTGPKQPTGDPFAGQVEGGAVPGGGATYVVRAGDTLSKIARERYGDAQQWRRIFEANREILDDPDLIHPGQKLRIPEAEDRGGRT